jgi:hypothetical protein
MTMDDFAPYLKINGCFVVRNITPDRQKTIKIFNYPIPFNQVRDLLQIPGVAEQDIRASLLKGELQHKIRARDIIIECSDIDLLQFNSDQKTFLQNAGIINGLEVTAVISTLPYLWREEIQLIGLKDGINRTFFTPDKFLNGTFITGDHFHIHIKHNGKDLYENFDYTIGESAGPGTGYDIINLISFAPVEKSLLFATYAIKV